MGRLDSVDPPVATAGGRVTLAGEGFATDAVPHVRIGGKAARVAAARASRLTVIVPEGVAGGPTPVEVEGARAGDSCELAVTGETSASLSCTVPSDGTVELRACCWAWAECWGSFSQVELVLACPEAGAGDAAPVGAPGGGGGGRPCEGPGARRYVLAGSGMGAHP